MITNAFRGGLWIIAACAMESVHADVLLNTGPGPNTPIGYAVYGPDSYYGGGTAFQSLAGEITVTQPWVINSVLGWMAAAGPAFNFPNGPVDINASIYNSAPANPNIYEGSSQPGTAIDTASFGFQFCANASQSSCPVEWQGATGLHWTLNPGTYWVVFEGVGSDTGWVALPGGVSSPLENSLAISNGQNWSELYPGGFGVQITGTEQSSAVPTPGLTELFLTGFGLLALARIGKGSNHKRMLATLSRDTVRLTVTAPVSAQTV
jgi:hypothetical protein